jgi:hypothetical protein
MQLFYDDFSAYPATDNMEIDLKDPHLGPWRENSMHYSWIKDDRPIFLDNPIAWRVIEIDGEKFLSQAEAWPNVTFQTGDELWDDYTLEAELLPQDKKDAGCSSVTLPVVITITSRLRVAICCR